MDEVNAAGQVAVKTPDEGVKANVVPAPEPQKLEVDYEALLTSKDAELEKMRQERENYKKAALKAKGKLPDDYSDDSEEETLEDKMRRIAQEQFLATREAEAAAQKDALIKDMARKLNEATLALKNRSQITPAGGSSGPSNEGVVKDNTFSADQLAELKKKFPHWTDKELEALKRNLSS
jgi:hypothetical protein